MAIVRGEGINLDSFHNNIISEVINLIYPIGSIYTTVSENNPSTFLKGTNWEKIGEGRVLMGANSSYNAGTTIDSGLPDIQGSHMIGWGDISGGGAIIRPDDASGAFYSVRNGKAIYSPGSNESYSDNHRNQIGFKASKYNSIYGASSIVQPPAFFCHFWKRTN